MLQLRPWTVPAGTATMATFHSCQGAHQIPSQGVVEAQPDGISAAADECGNKGHIPPLALPDSNGMDGARADGVLPRTHSNPTFELPASDTPNAATTHPTVPPSQEGTPSSAYIELHPNAAVSPPPPSASPQSCPSAALSPSSDFPKHLSHERRAGDSLIRSSRQDRGITDEAPKQGSPSGEVDNGGLAERARTDGRQRARSSQPTTPPGVGSAAPSVSRGMQRRGSEQETGGGSREAAARGVQERRGPRSLGKCAWVDPNELHIDLTNSTRSLRRQSRRVLLGLAPGVPSQAPSPPPFTGQKGSRSLSSTELRHLQAQAQAQACARGSVTPRSQSARHAHAHARSECSTPPFVLELESPPPQQPGHPEALQGRAGQGLPTAVGRDPDTSPRAGGEGLGEDGGGAPSVSRKLRERVDRSHRLQSILDIVTSKP